MRRSFAIWALVYAFCMIYVSVVIGPTGFNYVPTSLGNAWQALLAVRYEDLGSGQRADWMANLVMTIPLGFLWTAVFWVTEAGAKRWFQILLTFCGCAAFVIAVKYAQLFFPPRTVNLNYIAAQCLGAPIGIALYWVAHARLSAWTHKRDELGARAVRLVLALYAIVFVLFVLFPFDFVLSAADFKSHLDVLPQSLFSWPGAERSFGIRVVLMLANIVETIPLGILLQRGWPGPSLWRTTVKGLLLMSALTFVTCFVMAATPFLVSSVLRTIGISIGATMFVNWNRVNLTRLRSSLARAAPLLFVPYVFGVLYINGLFSSHWRTFEEARAALDVRGLLPLWHYYIVSKAHAMESLALHVVSFAPIGILISLRSERDRAYLAGLIAFIFSFAIEWAREMKPGLQADFNSAVIAAISAWLAVKATPLVWQMLESLSGDRPISSKVSKEA